MAEVLKPALFPRNLLPSLLTALADTPVVVLNGARQSGKSTLAHEVIRGGWRATYLSLDDAAVLAAARSDADGFVASLDGPAVLDEVQRAPDLFRAIKSSVDRDRHPGRFLLTGSAAVLLLPTITESLAGRAEILALWPLSQGELARRREAFVDVLFSDRLPRIPEGADQRRDVLRRAIRGGFPEAIARSDADRRAAWFASYVDTILQRDVRAVSDIEGLTEVPRLLTLLAARAGSILNMAELSRASGIKHRTLVRYLSLLEIVFLVRRIPAWSGNLGTRLVRHPKIVLIDTGLVAHLQGLNVDRFILDPVFAGPLLENFVAMELIKQIGWSATMPSLLHFRSHAGEEVDFVLERRDGTVVGVEVKASSSVEGEDLQGLRALARESGKKFRRGVVLYTGRHSVPFTPQLHALPISTLWDVVSSSRSGAA